MLLIPARDSTDRPLLSQLRIRDVIRSLPLVMLVHLSKLKLKFLVGYLKDHAKVNYTRLVGKISLIFVANCCKLHVLESTTKLVHNFSSNDYTSLVIFTLECTMAKVSTHTRHPPYSCLIA